MVTPLDNHAQYSSYSFPVSRLKPAITRKSSLQSLAKREKRDFFLGEVSGRNRTSCRLRRPNGCSGTGDRDDFSNKDKVSHLYHCQFFVRLPLSLSFSRLGEGAFFCNDNFSVEGWTFVYV